MIMNTKDIGNIGENAAARFLRKSKYKILERNLHISRNELDIIALDKKHGILSFIEVKSRTVDDQLYSRYGSPGGAVTRTKQQRTVEAAKAYLSANKRFQRYQPRFDVIEVYLKKEDLSILKINHIENAFGV